MGKIRPKLILVSSMLAMSVVLLVTASMAWFTLSTAPEITGIQVSLYAKHSLLVSRDGTNFSQSINISDAFEGLAPLKPVSTANGIDWFMPAYTADGMLDLENFRLATLEDNANVSIKNLIGNELFEAENRGYFVYTDFYLATDLEEGCTVSLSVPKGSELLDQWEKDQGLYGSYALANYAIDKHNQVATIDNNAQTALRIGFLIKETDKDGNPTTRFVIYEPNADQRSDPALKPFDPNPAEGSVWNEYYVSGFQLLPNANYVAVEGMSPLDPNNPKFLNYIRNSYIPTYPIGWVEKKEEVENEDGTTTEIVTQVPGLVTLDHENLLIQFAGQWNDQAVREVIREGGIPNSNHVSMFGRFIKNNLDVLGKLNQHGIYDFNSTVTTDLASGNFIVNLPPPDEEGNLVGVEIRMFIWLEGQDADCWNDIASGSFLVNLEFAAQS